MLQRCPKTQVLWNDSFNKNHISRLTTKMSPHCIYFSRGAQLYTCVRHKNIVR